LRQPPVLSMGLVAIHPPIGSSFTTRAIFLSFVAEWKGSLMSEIVVIIRPSFKKICANDACRAALFNHLLYWIARKAKGQTEEKIKKGEVYWYGSAEDICNSIDQSWSVNKVRKEIKELVTANTIGQKHNPYNGWDQTRYYFFGEEQGKILREQCEKYDICLNHLGLPKEVSHLLNLVNAFDKKGKCNCQINEMDLPNMADVTKSTSKGTSKTFPKTADSLSSQKNSSSGMTNMKEILERQKRERGE